MSTETAEPITKSQLAALGRIFAREVAGHVIYQTSRPAEIAKLEALEASGYCCRHEITIHCITCKGWALTTRGHIAYCESCK